jgi:hypothetical protein
MIRTTLAAATMTLLLAACGDKPGDASANDTASMTKEEVKAAVDKVQLKPGQWEGRFTVQDIDLSKMPGAPAGMKDQMKSMMSQTSLKYCVTPEEAANPSGEMFSGQENKDCTYQGFAVSGGSVKGQVSCRAEGGTMTAAMAGTYGGEAYAMDMDMKMAGGPDGMTMAMKARSEGKWIGPTCTKAE